MDEPKRLEEPKSQVQRLKFFGDALLAIEKYEDSARFYTEALLKCAIFSFAENKKKFLFCARQEHS